MEGFVTKCEKYVHLEMFQHYLLFVLFRLSEKAIFIEEYESLAILWNYLDE